MVSAAASLRKSLRFITYAFCEGNYRCWALFYHFFPVFETDQTRMRGRRRLIADDPADDAAKVSCQGDDADCNHTQHDVECPRDRFSAFRLPETEQPEPRDERTRGDPQDQMQAQVAD